MNISKSTAKRTWYKYKKTNRITSKKSKKVLPSKLKINKKKYFHKQIIDLSNI